MLRNRPLITIIFTLTLATMNLRAGDAVMWEKLSVSKTQADTLKTELVEQVQKVLNAGPLKPYFTQRGELHPEWHFTNPGDLVFALSRAYPHLPIEMQKPVKEYLRQAMGAHAPWSDALIKPDSKGTSRNLHELPQASFGWLRDEKYNALPRLHNLYALWLYTLQTSDAELINSHWLAIKAFYEKHRRDAGLYAGGLAGVLGFMRLAELKGAAAERDAAATHFQDAWAKFQSESATSEAAFKRWRGSDPWEKAFSHAGFHLLYLTPEIARLIRETPELRKAVQARTQAAVLQWPMWHLSQGSAFSRHYGESHALSPFMSAMIFPIRANVEQLPADRLRRYVDCEDAAIGDCFYLERLVLAIEATGESNWIDVRK